MNETRVVCIKGRIQIYGAELEHAPDLVYVGRACFQGSWRLPRSKWANPFSAQKMGGAEKAVEAYREWLLAPERAVLRAQIGELRGKQLGCWCNVEAGAPCHGRVLVWLAEPQSDVVRARKAWSDVLAEFGPDFEGPADRRRFETVRPAGRWAGAL